MYFPKPILEALRPARGSGRPGPHGRARGRAQLERTSDLDVMIHIYKRLSSVQQEVFTHMHDRHQTSVNKAVARVVEVRWLMKDIIVVFVVSQMPHLRESSLINNHNNIHNDNEPARQ
jgi:hypothetical protein